MAARQGLRPMVELLLTYKANIAVDIDPYGTPLHVAASQGCVTHILYYFFLFFFWKVYFKTYTRACYAQTLLSILFSYTICTRKEKSVAFLFFSQVFFLKDAHTYTHTTGRSEVFFFSSFFLKDAHTYNRA